MPCNDLTVFHVFVFKDLLKWSAFAHLHGHVSTLPLTIIRMVTGHVLPMQDGYAVLHYATKNGYNEIVDILLKHDAKPDMFDEVCKCS